MPYQTKDASRRLSPYFPNNHTLLPDQWVPGSAPMAKDGGASPQQNL